MQNLSRAMKIRIVELKNLWIFFYSDILVSTKSNKHLAYSIYCHRLTTKLCIILQNQITNHTFFYSPLFGSLCRSSLFPRQEKRVPKTYALLTTPHHIESYYLRDSLSSPLLLTKGHEIEYVLNRDGAINLYHHLLTYICP